ncbi:MAG: DUF4446 family protein [Lachnospiraceae bacterium]|nr:DUF4446 family protein [Lachnospiraceae bacterium]
MNLFEIIGLDMGYVLIGSIVFSLILLILVIVLFCKNGSLNKRYNAFMKDTDGISLEQAFTEKFESMDGLIAKAKKTDQRLAKIEETLLSAYQKVGIVKYDAFHEMGGKLSFALALLDDKNNGFLINCMHSTREGCYTYIKEVENGECSVILAEEEKQAIDMAVGNHS